MPDPPETEITTLSRLRVINQSSFNVTQVQYKSNGAASWLSFKRSSAVDINASKRFGLLPGTYNLRFVRFAASELTFTTPALVANHDYLVILSDSNPPVTIIDTGEGGGGGDGGGGGGGEPGGETEITFGDVKFKIVNVPAHGAGWPVLWELVRQWSNFEYEKDKARGPAMSAFQMGNTEVSWELWDKVRGWATARNYSFYNQGWKGSNNNTANTKHPVMKVSWFDAVVWCNALTEYYNTIYNPAVPLIPVYYYDAACTTVARNSEIRAGYSLFPVEESRQHAEGSQQIIGKSRTAYPKARATGFRLPTLDEWEFAYRYEGTQKSSPDAIQSDGIYFTRSDYASGAVDKSEVELSYVSWSGRKSSTAPVGTGRRPNKLNIYDMSGNAQEWLESWKPAAMVDDRMILSSYYGNTLEYNTLFGAYSPRVPAIIESHIGFRIARSR